MSLGDFQKFNEFGYKAFVNTIQQQIELFNTGSRGALALQSMSFAGDLNQQAAFENLSSLVGERNPSSTAVAASHALAELLKIEVKAAWGTPNISFTNTAFDWTKRDPAEAGTLFGDAVAEGAMRYMLNAAIGAAVAAIKDGAHGTVVHDGTAATASLSALNKASGLFGDRRSAIVAWVMHSKSQTDIFDYALSNSNQLFNFAGVRIVEDGHGRPLIETDCDALHFDNAGTENYIQLGLVSGAVAISEQGDMRTYNVTDLSEANAKQLMKAEGSFGLGVKGYTWDKTKVQPTYAQLATPANWAPVTSIGLKDTAGVKCITL